MEGEEEEDLVIPLIVACVISVMMDAVLCMRRLPRYREWEGVGSWRGFLLVVVRWLLIRLEGSLIILLRGMTLR